MTTMEKLTEDRAARLKSALGLALLYLETFEPRDSRAVSNEFVAMAAVEAGVEDDKCMKIIEGAYQTALSRGRP